MKKFAFITLLLIFSVALQGQSRQDQQQILQKCIDLKELQQYYPVDGAGSQKPLVIQYWHPVFFPTDLILNKDGKTVEFRPMSSENARNTEAYFLFTKFEIRESASQVCFDYFHTNPSQPNKINVLIYLQKAGDQWEISDLKLNNKD